MHGFEIQSIFSETRIYLIQISSLTTTAFEISGFQMSSLSTAVFEFL